MKILVTEHQLQSIIEQQSTGATRPVDLEFILSQSESGKTTNEFCKSKTDYDVCMFVQSSNPRVIQGKYDIRKNILTKSGYSMVEGGEEIKPGIVTSIWKKK